ncbi:MAG: helix-turn-helix domain-containing protein [Longimicrobiales bacterium]
MKILGVKANNRKKVFEVLTEKREYSFPYAKLEIQPTPANRVREVYPDPEVGCEAFTYALESGDEDTVHVDAVLEYNLDPTLLNDLLLYQLTLEAQDAIERSGLSKREVIRRLGTSASQFYRLLDQTYYEKSVGQMLALLRVLGMDVDLVVRPKTVSRKRRLGSEVPA